MTSLIGFRVQIQEVNLAAKHGDPFGESTIKSIKKRFFKVNETDDMRGSILEGRF